MKTWQTILVILAVFLVVGLLARFLSNKSTGFPNYQTNCITPVYNINNVEKIELKNCIAVTNYSRVQLNNNWTFIQEVETPLPMKASNECPGMIMGTAYCDNSQCVIVGDGACELRKYCPNGYERYHVYNETTKYAEDGWRCSQS
jgi:hypothetical protein